MNGTSFLNRVKNHPVEVHLADKFGWDNVVIRTRRVTDAHHLHRMGYLLVFGWQALGKERVYSQITDITPSQMGQLIDHVANQEGL